MLGIFKNQLNTINLIDDLELAFNRDIEPDEDEEDILDDYEDDSEG